MFKKIIVALAFVSTPAWADKPPFTGIDHSGRYQCKGVDSHTGPFEGVVDLKLNPLQSTGEHGAYSIKLTLPDNTFYDGFAGADSDSLAIYFAHQDPSLKDYGVGIAKISSTPDGKTAFSKYYYGPEYQGGGHGFETCVKS